MAMILTPGPGTAEQQAAEKRSVQRREQLRKWLIAENEKLKKTFSCPISGGKCYQNRCGLYAASGDTDPKTGCTLTQIADDGLRETIDKMCPVSGFQRLCSDKCALYARTGCRLTALMNVNAEGEE